MVSKEQNLGTNLTSALFEGEKKGKLWVAVGEALSALCQDKYTTEQKLTLIRKTKPLRWKKGSTNNYMKDIMLYLLSLNTVGSDSELKCSQIMNKNSMAIFQKIHSLNTCRSEHWQCFSLYLK